MAILRSRIVPQCSACLRDYSWTGLASSMAEMTPAWRQQVRGKKRMANNSANVTVRLLKDMKTFGRAGAIVPVSRGLMRNDWFKNRIAAYVTLPEMRALRIEDTPIARDYSYGMSAVDAVETPLLQEPDITAPAPVRKAPDVLKVTPERSLELLEIFVPQRLDFYRQPIPEEKPPIPPSSLPKPEQRQRTASSAGADLLEARTRAAETTPSAGPLSIYGSVSTQDILVMIRASIALNDEAARVTLSADDIEFSGKYAADDIEGDRIKRVGDFTVEIKVKGAEEGIRRTVRVIPQEA